MDTGIKSIDRFQVKKVLGEGGQGTVYLAHDPKLHRDVAIKTLFAGGDDDMAMLLQEARAVSALRHPCIVPVFEAGNVGKMHYLVFEFVTGDTIQEVIRRQGAMASERALEIASQVLDALGHAHKNGVLHRDIKPANIILGSDGTPRIMDFGAASRNHLNWLNGSNVAVDVDFIGTPSYMAPEYVAKRQFSAKTDIYSAGLVIYEMLTGQKIFKVNGGGLDELFASIVNDPIVMSPGTGLDEKVIACLLKALAKNPDDRFDSVLEMKQALLNTNSAAIAGAKSEAVGTLDFLLRRMKLKKEFPALSASVTSINSIIHSNKGSITTLTNAVLKDFSLTSKIIKLANSAYYNPSGSGKISTISAAIYRLGFDTIRNIVIGLLLFDQVKDRDQAKELMTECMKAVMSGAIAKEICVAQRLSNPEESFVCAMMHNLGRMLSTYYFPEETSEIRNVLELANLGEDDASRQVLGASYTELGQGVAKTWGFPDTIIGSMDKRPPANAARGEASEQERVRLIACMASELSAVIIGCNPDEHRKKMAELLEKYKGHIKLDQKSTNAVLGKAVEKFEDYTKAVGWKLDQTVAKRINALHKTTDGSEESDEKTVAGEFVTGAEIEKTVHQADVGAAGSQTGRRVANESLLNAGIQEITNALVDGRGLTDILRIIAETIYTGAGFEHVVIALRDQASGQMLGRLGLGDGASAMMGKFRFPLTFSPDVFHISLRKNMDVFITDTMEPQSLSRIPPWYRSAIDAKSFMLFPIVVRDKPFGIIYAGTFKANSIALDESSLKSLRTLRNQAVLAVRQSV